MKKNQPAILGEEMW